MLCGTVGSFVELRPEVSMHRTVLVQFPLQEQWQRIWTKREPR